MDEPGIDTAAEPTRGPHSRSLRLYVLRHDATRDSARRSPRIKEICEEYLPGR